MSQLAHPAALAEPLSAGGALRLEPSLVQPSLVQPSLASAGDYLELLKPRVMSLVVFTALVGMVVAPGHLHPVIGFTALLCIAVGAGAAGALNMWYDSDLDIKMARTAQRPIPRGRIAPGEALGFGLTLAGFAVTIMGLLINVLSAALLAFTIFFYAMIYTVWLKRWTPQNIVIGGAAGAFPPVIGWAAVAGQISLEPLLLFLIIFVWTPPHFWALSLVRADEYARAGVPMLPVVSGVRATRLQILIYSALLVPVGALPWLFGYAGLAYGLIAVATGVLFLLLALRLYRTGDVAATSDRAAKQLFAYSVLYLFLLFAVLLVEDGFGLASPRLFG